MITVHFCFRRKVFNCSSQLNEHFSGALRFIFVWLVICSLQCMVYEVKQEIYVTVAQ